MLDLLNRLRISTRVVGATLVIVAAVVAVNYTSFVTGFKRSAQEAMVERARAFSAVADEAKNHASLLHRTGTFDTASLAKEVTRDLAAGRKVSETRFFQTIPVVAGWTAAREAARRENIQFRISSFDARNPANAPAPGSFEETLLRKLSDQVKAGGEDAVYAIEPSGQSLHFLRAIKLTDNCLGCHGQPGTADDTLKTGRDITGARMEGWKAGQMHGSYHIVMPLAPLRAQVTAFLARGLGWSAPTIIIALALFVWIVVRTIGQPLGALSKQTLEIAHGKLDRDLPQPLRERPDEVGDLARSMQSMSESLRSLLHEVTGGVHQLASASSTLNTVSRSTSQEARNMSDRATTVAAAAEEASANSASVAAGMEQAAANLSSVASATEEMSATVGEIASNSEKARAISEQANAQAQTISSLMLQLGEAAREIGKVTETITDISSQTNLLALNATIEAARAGAAGKGFAVVANEIKELARQTASATEDIKAKIAGVQTSAGGAIADIEKIASIIKEVGAIVSSIAAAIEEQAAVTKDVASNIAQASAGVKDANERVSQTASVSRSIAQDIAQVTHVVSDISAGGDRVQSSAGELSQLAAQLTQTLARFHTSDSSTTTHPAPAAAGPTNHGTRSGASGTSHPKATAPQSPAPARGGTPASGEFMPWKSEYSVGVTSMDAHHKKLVAIINRLHDALKQGATETVTKGILRELVSYTQYHFKAEEELMARNNYADLPGHQKIHREFLDVVAGARDRWEAGDSNVPNELLALLEKWLVGHITKVDQQYGICFAKLAAGAKDPTCRNAGHAHDRQGCSTAHAHAHPRA